MQRKAGRKLDLRLNISTGPIANKYREGKLKSTLKRESKDRETAQSISPWSFGRQPAWQALDGLLSRLSLSSSSRTH